MADSNSRTLEASSAHEPENARESDAQLPWLWLVLPLLVGTALRMYRVDAQLLTGDELHLMNAVAERTIGEITREWTRFGADYSVPLGVLFRTLSDLGMPISEMNLRAPMLLSSIALLIAAPRLLAPSLGARSATALAWALALSPLLVIYGRMARSYAPVVLLAFAALMAFDRFQRTGTFRSGLTYAGCASLALYAHLPAAPLVLAPLAYGALRLAYLRFAGNGPSPKRPGRARAVVGRRELGFGFPRLVAVGAATGALSLLFLFPALDSLIGMRAIHGEGAVPGPGAWFEVLCLHSGTQLVPLTLVVALLAVRGAVVLFRRDRLLFELLAATAGLHLAGLIVLGPDQLDNPIVINRYLLTLLPFELALVSLGATRAPHVESVRSLLTSWRQSALAALLALGVFVSGPLATREFRTSSFLQASTFARFTEPGNRVDREAMPRSYEDIIATGRREPIIEYPWSNVASHAFDAYQKHHELPVLFGSYGDSFANPRISARNTVVGQPRDIIASRAGFIVVHLDLEEEESRVLTNDPHHWRRLRDIEQIWAPLHRFGPQMDEHLRNTFGPPDFEDRLVSVWDLARLRDER